MFVCLFICFLFICEQCCGEKAGGQPLKLVAVGALVDSRGENGRSLGAIFHQPGPLRLGQHTGSKFEMDVATFGLDFLEECTTQGRTRSPSDGVPLFQGSFCSIIPWPIRWHEYDTLQMILGIFRHHGAHSCRLSGSNNLLMWLAQHGCLRTELNQFVANS